MATTSVDQITGYGETVAYKAPCRLATTANIALSGLQTIDGVLTVANDRVLVKDQSIGPTNGIYIASAGAWQRARDMDSNRDLTKGTRLTVIEGAANAGREYYVSTSNPITVGTTSLAFTETLSSNAGASATASALSAAAALGYQNAAAASATSAANSVAAIPYAFSITTADADPGAGTFRLNNATIASATAAYVDNVDSDGVTQTGILDTFDDSTNTIRGVLTIRSKTTPATKRLFNVTGLVVDGTGYRKLTLAYVGGAGAIANGEVCWLIFDRAGDKGTDGTAGNFTGPGSSVTDNILTFANTTGALGKDSGVAVSSLAPKASPTFTGTPAAPTAGAGTNTTQLATTAFVKAAIDVVLGGVAAAYDTLSEIAAAVMLKATDNLGLTAGFTSTVVDDGTKSTGTYTPAPTGGNYRKIAANGAFTLAAPSTSNSYNMTIDITNGVSAGAITFSGFVTGHPKGDAYATTSAAKFKLHISKTDAGVTGVVEAL